MLLLAPHQETGIGGIDRDQVSVSIACRMEALVGATSDPVAFVSHDGRCVAETMSDRADDFPVPVSNVILFQHEFTFPLLKYT